METVKIDAPAYFKMALKAKYWITNTNIERGLKFKKKSQVYLNTWHGIALKYIGNDCPGRKDYNFDTLDYLTVSGDYDERVFKSAFNARDPLRWGGFAKEDCIAACESMDSPPWLSTSFIVFTYGQPYNIHACLYSAFRI